MNDTGSLEGCVHSVTHSGQTDKVMFAGRTQLNFKPACLACVPVCLFTSPIQDPTGETIFRSWQYTVTCWSLGATIARIQEEVKAKDGSLVMVAVDLPNFLKARRRFI